MTEAADLDLAVHARLYGCDVIVEGATGTDVFEVFAALHQGERVDIVRLYPGFRADISVCDHVRAAMQLFVSTQSPVDATGVLPRVQAVADDAWIVQGWSSRCVGIGSLVHQMKAHDLPPDLMLVADVVVPICMALRALGGDHRVQARAVVVDTDGVVKLWCAEHIARPQRPPPAPSTAAALAEIMMMLLGGRPGSRVIDVAPECEAALGAVVDACRAADPPSLAEIIDALRQRVSPEHHLGPGNMAELLRVLCLLQADSEV